MNDPSNDFDPDFSEWSDLWNDPDLSDVEPEAPRGGGGRRPSRGRLSHLGELLAGALLVGAVAAPDTLTATSKIPHLGLTIAALVALVLPLFPFWLGGVGRAKDLSLPTVQFAAGAQRRLRRQLIATLLGVLSGVGLLSIAIGGGVARPILAAVAGLAVVALSVTRSAVAVSLARQHGEALDSLLDVDAGRMALPSRTGPKLALAVIVSLALAGAIASGLHARGPHGVGEHESVDVPVLITVDDSNPHVLWELWNLADYSIVDLEGGTLDADPDDPLETRVRALEGALAEADAEGHGLVFVELAALGDDPGAVLAGLSLEDPHVAVPEHATVVLITAGDFAVYQPSWLEPSRWAHRVSFGGPAPALRYVEGGERKTALLEALGDLEGFRIGDVWAKDSMDVFKAHHLYNLGLELPGERRDSLRGFAEGVGVSVVTVGGIFVTQDGGTLWVETPEEFRVVLWTHPSPEHSVVFPAEGRTCSGLPADLQVQRFRTLDDRSIEITPVEPGTSKGGTPRVFEVEVEPNDCRLVEVDG